MFLWYIFVKFRALAARVKREQCAQSCKALVQAHFGVLSLLLKSICVGVIA